MEEARCVIFEQARSDLLSLPRVPKGVCWFCLQPLIDGQYINKHHRIARRFRQNLKNSVNAVRSHAFCHTVWHKYYDHGRLDWDTYRSIMVRFQYGYGAFAQARWLAKGYKPKKVGLWWTRYHPTGRPNGRPFFCNNLPKLAYIM